MTDWRKKYQKMPLIDLENECRNLWFADNHAIGDWHAKNKSLFHIGKFGETLPIGRNRASEDHETFQTDDAAYLWVLGKAESGSLIHQMYLVYGERVVAGEKLHDET